LFCSGTLFGLDILTYDCITDAGYANNGLMLMSPMALIIVACIIWWQRAHNKDLQQK
jgi:Na+-transporting NADH:ubiquinone oxidoreductase subunit D